MNTIIGKGSVIEGTLQVEGDLRIDGTVKGEITSTESLTVGDEGVVEANLNAKATLIDGIVIGNIFAPEKIELQSRARVEGEITTKNLMVEEGAIFHGKCNMKEYPQPSPE